MGIPITFVILYEIYGLGFIFDIIQPHWVFNNDNLRFIIPKFAVIQEALSQHQIPLWNPYEGCGQPLLAGGSKIFWEAAALYVLHPVSAMIIIANLHIFLSLWFFFLCGRELGYSRRAVFLGGLIWTFNGYHTWYLYDLSILGPNLWLPLVIFCFLRAQLGSHSLGWGAMATLAMGVQALYGRPPESFLLAGFFTCFVLAKTWHDSREKGSDGRWGIISHNLGLWAAIIIGGFCLSAVVTLPLAESLGASNRFASGDPLYTKYISFNRAIEVFFPNIAICFRTFMTKGITTTNFLFFGLVSIPFLLMSWNARPKWLARFFCVTLLTSLLFSFPFGFFDLVREIPLFTGIRHPSRFLSWTMLSIAFLVCMGYDRVTSGLEKQKPGSLGREIKLFFLILPLIFCSGALLLLLILHFKTSGYLSQIVIIALSMIAIVAFYLSQTRNFSKKAAYLILVGTLFFTLFISNQYNICKGDPAERKNAYFNIVPNLKILKYLQEQEDRWSWRTFYFMGSDIPFGERFLMPQLDHYGAFIDPKAKYVHNQVKQEVKNLLGKPGAANTPDRPKPRWLNLANVRYIVVNDHYGTIASSLGYPRLAHDGGLKGFSLYDEVLVGFSLYQNPNVLPRFYLVSGFKVIQDEGELLKFMSQPAPAWFEENVVLSETPGKFSPINGAAKGKVLNVQYGFNEVTVKVNCPQPAILVCVDTYSPGWEVSVDGRPDKILRANYMFRAVALFAGEHEVKFKYLPRSFVVGAMVSGLTLLALGVFLFFVVRGRRQGSHRS